MRFERHPATCVLAVSSSKHDHVALDDMFSYSSWSLHQADSVTEAMQRLRLDPVPVVLCERSLSDGDWKDLLTAMAIVPEPSNLIVMAKHPDDRLWAEALNVGAYDVLSKPFDTKEVFRVIGLAGTNWMY